MTVGQRILALLHESGAVLEVREHEAARTAAEAATLRGTALADGWPTADGGT